MIGGALSRGTRSGRWLAARIRVQSGRPWGVSRGMVVELFNSYAVGESKTHNHQHINTLTYILCGLITWLTVTRGHVTCITWQIHSFIHGSDNWSILSPWMRIISQKLFKTKRDSAGVRQETGKSYVGKSVWPACFSGCWSNIPTYISILNVCVGVQYKEQPQCTWEACCLMNSGCYMWMKKGIIYRLGDTHERYKTEIAQLVTEQGKKIQATK